MGEAATIAERAGRRARAAWRRRNAGEARGWNPLRVAVRAGLVVAGALTALLATMWLLASMSPAWWGGALRLEGVDADVGERVERAIATETHRAREPGTEWAIALTQEQANAWLRDRLPKWASNRGAARAARYDVRVRFEPGSVLVGVREREGGRVLSARIEPELRSDGSLWARLSGVRVGRLPAPSAWTLEALRGIGGAQMGSPGEVLAGSAAAVPKAEARLEDGRRVRAREVRVEAGRLVVVCETQSPVREAASP